MPAGRYTSRVFVVGEAIKTALDGISWPAFQNRTPVPTMGAVDPGQDREQIGVVLTPQATSADWVNMSPAGKNEIIGFDVVHYLGNPNIKTPDEVWQRLEEVADLIQSIAYNTVTETVTDLGYTGELWTTVRSVRPAVGPGDSGFIGHCVTTIETQARI